MKYIVIPIRPDVRQEVTRKKLQKFYRFWDTRIYTLVKTSLRIFYHQDTLLWSMQMLLQSVAKYINLHMAYKHLEGPRYVRTNVKAFMT